MAVGVAVSGCGGYDKPAEQPPPPKEEAPPPPPPPKPIALAELSPVTIDPGQRVEVEIQIERAGNAGPIEVGVEGAPEGVTVKPADIPEGGSAGKLELAAAEKLGDEPLKATLQVTVKLGELEAKQPLALTVNQVKLPSFVAPGAVIFQPGTTKTIDLGIERGQFEGPLELRVEDVPEKFTATVANVAASESGTKVEITAAPDAPEGAQTLRVATTILGRNVDVEVPFQVDRSPYLVKSFMVVTLEPGESKSVEIPIERRAYKGPIQLEIVDLPVGVTAPKVDVPADQAKALVHLSAAADAKEGVRSAKVTSTAGQLRRTDPLVVRVAYPDSGFLPREVSAGQDSTALLRRGSFGGRLTAEGRNALVNAYGGTEESEQAVLRGLRWLAAHQQPDGNWSLEYWKNVRGCDCPTEIEKKLDESDTAATAFGVLPMLGIGITHRDGPKEPPELIEYRKKVFAGLTYLTGHQAQSTDKKKAGHLGGSMYAHALGTMALCEAYGLSGDERLKLPAQMAVRYMAEAQHKAGGWRYSPGQAGDMSVTAWVFLAIRSAQLAGLPIGSSSLVRAERFVDSCAVGPDEARRSRYAYLPPTPEAPQSEKLTLSAAGLLTRQYLGWPKDNPELVAGCRYLIGHLPPESGTQLGQVYYYHYASQVLHHMEGSDFDLWNHRMREHLIRTQEKEGHRAGSWSPEGTDYGSRGGRLYATAMALLTLEVYYRHLPMYRPVKRTAD